MTIHLVPPGPAKTDCFCVAVSVQVGHQDTICSPWDIVRLDRQPASNPIGCNTRTMRYCWCGCLKDIEHPVTATSQHDPRCIRLGTYTDNVEVTVTVEIAASDRGYMLIGIN